MLQRIASLLRISPPAQENSGLLMASGPAVPTDGTAGYQPGCIFQHTDGSAGTVLYVNEGTASSCDFNAIAGLTAAQEAKLDSLASDLANITATSTEINSFADQSANTEDVSGAGALSITKRVSQIAGGEGFAVTLAAPTAAQVGKIKIITLESITSGAVTLALTNVIGGSAGTSASFDAAGETLTLVAVEATPAAFMWLVLDEHGVTLS